MATAESAKVLVTGASGYIASHVVLQLLEAGHVVRGTVRSLTDDKAVHHLPQICPQANDRLQLVEADLLEPDSWLSAVEGMDYVIHTASPYPPELPEEDEDILLKPAVEGTLHVLKACAQEASVKRVVFTSCALAVKWGRKKVTGTFTEEDWSDVKDLDACSKSKMLAEKAAWDFIHSLPEERNLQMAVINPALTMGPPLGTRHCTNTLTLQKLLDHLIPGLPKMNFPIADVRDVAQAHLRALTSSKAAGHRHIICSGNLWMSEMAKLLKCVFGPQGYDIPSLVAPSMMLRMVGKVDGTVRPILPYLELVFKYDNSRMLEALDMKPRNMRDTIVDMAHGMIQKGLARQSSTYTGPKGEEERKKYLAVKF